MIRTMLSTRVILIGGPSHAGKTILAASMASKLEWRHISTDSLAPHPGRPWKTASRGVPEHVAEHYLSLSVDDLIADVLRHYDGLWPAIEALIEAEASAHTDDGLIIEGSALLPERVGGLQLENVVSIWLTANSDILKSRIWNVSGFERGSANERALIEKFVARNDRYNDLMMDVVRRLDLPYVDVESSSSTKDQVTLIFRLIDER